MSSWLASAVTRAETVTDSFLPQRQVSLALLQAARWPTRKTEAWKYTPLKALENAAFAAALEAPAAAAASTAIDGLDSIDLIFVDGCFKGLDSSIELPAGLSVVALSELDAANQQWAVQQFTSIKPARHLFGLVNDVLAQQGVLIDIAANAIIDKPIRIVQQLVNGVEAHTRILVRLGERAKACVIEQAMGDVSSFNTSFAEYDLADHSALEHYRFALQTGEAISVGGSHIRLANHSSLNSTLVGFGSVLSRLDVDVIHGGEFGVAKLNAIFLLDGTELFDLHSTIEHAMPNGTTEENVRGIIADRARAVFNGRIHIHRGAQKTLAELNNRNLLMSDKAEINTKPELEIYADDVRCAHGATIAEIDKKALYYMQTRGVSRSRAQVMLNFGFINELIDQMPNAALADWLRPIVRERFSKMEVK